MNYIDCSVVSTVNLLLITVLAILAIISSVCTVLLCHLAASSEAAASKFSGDWDSRGTLYNPATCTLLLPWSVFSFVLC